MSIRWPVTEPSSIRSSGLRVPATRMSTLSSQALAIASAIDLGDDQMEGGAGLARQRFGPAQGGERFGGAVEGDADLHDVLRSRPA